MESPVITTKEELLSDAKVKLNDILMDISWRELSRKYFGRSSSWLYHKLDGIKGDGSKGGFTPNEVNQLKAALNDLASRIITSASSL